MVHTADSFTFDDGSGNGPGFSSTADALEVRGIDVAMDPARLTNVTPADTTPFGPSWDATHDGKTSVRVFGLRASSSSGSDGEFVDSVVGALRAQVQFSHPFLAQPIGVVAAIPFASANDGSAGSWLGLVYPADPSSTEKGESHHQADFVALLIAARRPDPALRPALSRLLLAARFLDVVGVGQRAPLSIIDPALVLNGGREMACWGLLGAVDGLWLDATVPTLAPEWHEDPSQALDASLVYAVGVWAGPVLSSSRLVVFGSYNRADLESCVEDDPEAGPMLDQAVYAALAELAHPKQGWSWAHYACEVDDVIALRHYLAVGGDLRRLTLVAPELSLEDVARANNAGRCLKLLCGVEAGAMQPASLEADNADQEATAFEGTVVGTVTVTRTATFGIKDIVKHHEDGRVEIPEWVQDIPWAVLRRSEKIGSGGFGTVYRAELRGASVAVKVMRVMSKGVMRNIRAEVAAHAQIRHPRVLLMMGVVNLTKDDGASALGIVSEFMGGGDLATKIKAARDAGGDGGDFDTSTRALVLRQAAEGIAYLHDRGLIHRDIKPANILLTAGGEAKIGDLGLVADASGLDGWTRRYAAPEILLGTDTSSFSSDVYSFANKLH